MTLAATLILSPADCEAAKVVLTGNPAEPRSRWRAVSIDLAGVDITNRAGTTPREFADGLLELAEKVHDAVRDAEKEGQA